MSLSLDFNLILKAQVGHHGLTRSDFDGMQEAIQAAHHWLMEGRKSGAIAFLELPNQRNAIEASKALGERLRSFENLVVLGIGGSSLGAKALFSALCHPQHNLLAKDVRGFPRVFFPDNADANTFAALFDVIDIRQTAFAAITKSGGTAETWAQLLYVLEKLGPENARKQIVAVTDPEKGALRKVASQEGWPTLPVPPEVGGRFSVLSAVGLLPAVASGIDVDALLRGAGAMALRCENENLFLNPAYMLAASLFLMDRKLGRNIHVLMPYADALRETADWFVQLWAESLGKRTPSGHLGPTPVRAVGATDQHSLLQLLMEGPQDKCILFVSAQNSQRSMVIPADRHNQPDVSYLSGHSMHELLSAEQMATAAALAANGRPSITLKMPVVDEFHVGEMLMLLEVATAVAGHLYGVNPFDQPGVEAGKRYTCGLLGRPGYEEAKKELAQRPRTDLSWVV